MSWTRRSRLPCPSRAAEAGELVAGGLGSAYGKSPWVCGKLLSGRSLRRASFGRLRKVSWRIGLIGTGTEAARRENGYDCTLTGLHSLTTLSPR